MHPTTHTTPSVNPVPLNLRVQSPVKAPQRHAPLLPITCYLLPILALLATIAPAKPLRWEVESSRPLPAQFTAYQGETLTLHPCIKTYGTPISYPPAATATLYWQTNHMANTWWQAPATLTPTNITATWLPTYDPGTSPITLFIGIQLPESNALNYSAHATLRLLPSPGTQPNHIPLPTPTIDFSQVTILNPPWPNPTTTPTATDLQTATNHLTTQLQSEYLPYGPRIDRLENIATIPHDRIQTPDANTWLHIDTNSTATIWRIAQSTTPTYTIPPELQDHLGNIPPQKSYLHPFTDGTWASIGGGDSYGIVNTASGAIWLGSGSLPQLLLPLDHRASGTATISYPSSPQPVGTVALTSQLAPTLIRDGIHYRQYWDTNLLTTAWEPLP